MNQDAIRILGATDIDQLLANREIDIINTVRTAYEVHRKGASSLPHSLFLRFPNHERNRIIALPAYLGENFETAGVKWIASFPENHTLGLPRASAVIIINSMQTGRPTAILEGSLISAKRTAASAALATQFLHSNAKETTVSFIGTGLINFEVARFLLASFPTLRHFGVFDMLPEQAEKFKNNCLGLRQDLEITIAGQAASLFKESKLVSIATTAVKPHLDSIAGCTPDSTILHISLRDFTPEVVLQCDNVVDDIDHVLRAETSVHLAEQQVGKRDFIRCTLADVTIGSAPPRNGKTLMFSPFGLGVLDLALSKLVLELAETYQRGTTITSFLPS